MFLVPALVLLLSAVPAAPTPSGPSAPWHSMPVVESVSVPDRALPAQPALRRPDSTLALRLHRAFAQGDAGLATAEAAPRLHVTVRGEGGRYSRAQAAFVLDAFFREHPPVRVSLSTAGVAEGARSLMGRYVAEGDLSFRIGVRLRLKGERWEVIGIEVDQVASESGGGQ